MDSDSIPATIKEADRTLLLKLIDKLLNRPSGESSNRRDFEYAVLRAFELEGATVVWPYSVNFKNEEIEQIDGAVHVEHLSCLVESKDYNHRVNVEPIAKLRNQLLRRPANTVGLVFSRLGFTEPAKVLTQLVFPQTILLWDGFELQHAVEKTEMISGLMTKYRYAVQEGLPYYHLLTPGAD